MATTSNKPHSSPFFSIPATAEAGSLAILHLKRDALIPITLQDSADDGYAEGAVTNTRFGSFPHKTLIGLEWGSQVRASKVDTGTRGRKAQKARQEQQQQQIQEQKSANGDAELGEGRKRKSVDIEPGLASPTKRQKQARTDGQAQAQAQALKAPVEAGSGFLHILPPTPEAWTASLDHRTQVVYTPDYSYVLQRLRVRPGSRIIEAGAGSGSFTHAAARAVFDGYPNEEAGRGGKGRVYSFEYHEPRVQSLRRELDDHSLQGVVELTHRDVCNEGFELADGSMPMADAVFLDLPAPWVAIKHLTRELKSPLDPEASVHLCTFSPCIEQVMATTSMLRKTGWTEVDMVEVMHRRIDVRRERVGLKEEGLRGVNAVAATVEEAIERHREFESKLLDFHSNKKSRKQEGSGGASAEKPAQNVSAKQKRLEQNKKDAEERKLYKEGNLVHRTEPDVKTHTSYLVFATLPREWTDADETAMLEKWPVADAMKGSLQNGSAFAPKDQAKVGKKQK